MSTTISCQRLQHPGDGPDDGEAYMAFTIATPTGEGVTSRGISAGPDDWRSREACVW